MSASSQKLVVAALAACALFPVHAAAAAQESPPAKDLNAKSLPLRTALHHDPALASPLEQLLSMYRSAGRVDELIGMYRAHVSRYPQDASARTVLVRLLAATGDPGTLDEARSAAKQFSQDAYLHYVLYEILCAKDQTQALDALDKAIELETRPGRKMAWIDVLLPMAAAEGRQELAEKHLRAMAGLVDAPEERLEVARRMNKYKFFQPALDVLDKKSDSPPAPETMVSIELEAAAAEEGLGKTEAAAARLDRLLSKLTADYWRRAQIVRRRLALVKSEAEREAIIGEARKRVEKNPRDEAAVLDLAQVLTGLEFRRDALEVLLEAGRRLPQSAQIERRTLELLDRLRDARGREEYLAERIKQQPERTDLVLRHVKTLYLLGRSDDAVAELSEMVDAMETEAKSRHLLETARFLRRSALLDEAAELFRRALESDPSRLDVRRELAETYLAAGNRPRLRELFSAVAAKEASLENLLDLAQFMIQQELYSEVRTLISERLGQEKENLELRMLLLDVERRLGNSAAGQELLADSRALADTSARYRLWLESAAAFHEEFDSLDTFLRAERTRLEEEPSEWTTRRLERRLAFAEIAARTGHSSDAAAMLERDLDDNPPPEARIKIRRQLVAVLEEEAGRTTAVQDQLKELIEEDDQYADQYRARLALVHANRQRQDLAVALLDQIEFARIHDPAILTALCRLCDQHPEGRRQKLAILERLTVLDPADRSNWQNWLTALAVMGNEARLRSALRQLLAGVEKMPLADPTRSLLESHLADSYWRDIGRCLADEQGGSAADALGHLAEVEPMAQSDQQWLWIAWIRAYLLSRLGREQALKEAMAELERVAADVADGNEAARASGLRIAFPDGLSVSLDHARKLLSASAARPVEPVGARQGPLPEFQVKWSYETDPQGIVTAIVPLGGEHVLICDAQGEGHCVHATTGKLLWRRSVLPMRPIPLGTPPGHPGSIQQRLLQLQMARQMLAHMPPAQRTVAAQQIQQQLQSLLAELAVPSMPLGDGQGRFYVPAPSRVTSYAVDDGRLLWEAEVGALGTSSPSGPAATARPYVSIFLYQNKLLTYEPASGTVTRIDPATGKIVWDRTLAAEQPASVNWHNSGASLCGHRLLVYGAKTAILDVETGEIEWSFEPWRTRSFPIKLDDPSIRGAVPAVAVAAVTHRPHYVGAVPPGAYRIVYSRSFPTPPGYYPVSVYRSGPSQPPQFLNYLEPQSAGTSPPGHVSLTGPAVVWASLAQQGGVRHARLMDGRLLLFDQSGLLVIRTDLPLAGRRVSAAGQFVGMAGRAACLLSGSQLQFVDVTSGQLKQFDVQEISTGPVLAPIQATMDGPLVYVTGPGGILGVRAITAQRAFKAEWPGEVASAASAPSTTPLTTTRPPPVPSPYYPSPSAPVVGLPGYTPGYSPYSGVPGIRLPTINHVDRGTLYATVTPNQVVALTGRSADGP